MAEARWLGVAVVLAGVASVAAAPVAPAPTPTVKAPAISVQALAKPSLTITKVEFAGAGYNVTVDNPTTAVAGMELHFKGKTFAFGSKNKAPSIVPVTDPESVAVCNIGTLAFNLTGPNADTRVRHAELAGSPAFTAKGGVVSGTPQTPIDTPTAGKVAVMGGGPTHWYGCGQKFEVSVLVNNDTTVVPQHASLELFDTDNTKIGEAPVTLPANTQTSLVLGSTANVSGRLGIVRARLTDSTTELAGKLIGGRDLTIEITRTGPVSIKLVD